MVTVSKNEPRGAYAVLLGTAQDGGIPHIGCRCGTCQAARRYVNVRRYPSSLLIFSTEPMTRYLIDATPALPEQIEIADRMAARQVRNSRAAPFDGIFITHAHCGHYTGLMHLGPEAWAVREQTVYATERMCSFLRANAPWELLVRAGHIRTVAIEFERPLDLGGQLSVTAIAVPHRAEYTDTCAFVVRGPRRALLYAPDTDRWDGWSPPVEDLIASVDAALLDGTFFDDGELHGRTAADVPHPAIQETIARFSVLPAQERAKVHFIHLNHTNPAAVLGGAAESVVREAGMQMARERQVLAL